MTYSVKEIFYTLQGEGHHTGRPAVFCRFAGCNLWNGVEDSRSSAVCQFCDTDFVGVDGEGGGKFTNAQSLTERINALWPSAYPERKYVVLTGGEPLLQLDVPLIAALHAAGFEIAIETNGTLPVPEGVDWVCVSPKMGATLVVRQGHEVKVVIPQLGQPLDEYAALPFAHHFVRSAASHQPAPGHCVLQSTSAVEAQLADAQTSSNPLMRLRRTPPCSPSPEKWNSMPVTAFLTTTASAATCMGTATPY
jgi:7-carboxy-7-deazaguanine synthase